jgi:hypothetical protein
MNVTLVTEGIPPPVCESMGFRHILPAQLNSYLGQQLKNNPKLKIGILRQSAEVLPVINSSF